MSTPASPLDVPAHEAVAAALRSLGGNATVGDLILATGLPRGAVEAGLELLLATGRAEVAVVESAVLLYRSGSSRDARRPIGVAEGPRSRAPRRRRDPSSSSGRSGTHPFDRKTLRLLRARGGVISVAELVEHTGLTVPRAEAEARRLVSLYGGEVHPSLDGHRVYVFPSLVETAHDSFSIREPRPAWARSRDPMRRGDGRSSLSHRWLLVCLGGLGLAFASLLSFPPDGPGRILILSAVAGVSAAGAFVASRVAGIALRHLPLLRAPDQATLRRYLLGLVVETALKGKGIVSVGRATEYLGRRVKGGRVSRRRVRHLLTGLAREFDATISELDGEQLFGFRNVKRQFLASHLVRVRLGLERRASGEVVFDSGDGELAASARELAAFDRELAASAPGPGIPDREPSGGGGPSPSHSGSYLTGAVPDSEAPYPGGAR